MTSNTSWWGHRRARDARERTEAAQPRRTGATSITTRLASSVITLAALGAISGSALAQGTGRSLDIDPSAIAAGMGGASNAVFWTAEPNYWANPALLGYYRGLRWQWGRTQLVPGLANDVFFTTGRLTVGLPGVAVALAGKPFEDIGGIDLDYGSSQGTDPGGNPASTLAGGEEIYSYSYGVSAMGLLDGLTALFGGSLPPIARYFDAAYGYAEKELEMTLAPSVSGTAESDDEGYLIRGGIGTDVLDLDGPPVRIDVSYGESTLNEGDAFVTFTNDGSSPLTRTLRKGVAARASVGVTRDMKRSDNGMLRWLAEGADHVVALGYAKDRTFVSAGAGSIEYETQHDGVELDLMNVIALRYGHYRDLLGNIDGDAWGIGVTARYSSIFGVRYDFGTQPQAKDSGLRDLQRHQVSVFFDPFSFSRRLRH